MPNYSYRCKSCQYTFQQNQSMRDEPLKTCPKCSGQLERVIGKNVGIRFVGSGFYINDTNSSSKSES